MNDKSIISLLGLYLILIKVITTVEFNDYNTNSTRRGKFGCSWASDSTVFILNNSHWSSEEIPIEMR